MILKKIICCVFIFNLILLAQQNITLKGYVYDLESKKPLSDVNVIANINKGTTTDKDGFFKLNLLSETAVLRFNHMGYYNQKTTVAHSFTDTLYVYLKPEVLKSSETIMVESSVYNPLDKNNDKWLNSTDDILERFTGVNTLKRANFATEPVIRGSSAGQIAIVIDDMKMFHACVDRMDPVSAYVEVENLEKMEVSKGSFNLTNGSVIGGTLNFITAPARLDHPLKIETEAGYESVSGLNRIRNIIHYGTESFAVRGSFSLKSAEDYYAGNRKRINNSGFEKNNYTLSMVNNLGKGHFLRFNYIGDNARDIGYPALIMDATKTTSHIASVNYTVSNITDLLYSIDIKSYYTQVKHWMDDYSRSVEEIKNRVVMPNMYMPMYGDSETYGFISKATFFPASGHISRLIFDYYHLNAFADMDMYSLGNDLAPAYLVNLPDIRQDNFAAILDHYWSLTKNLQLRSDIRYDFSSRNIFDEFGKRQLKAMWQNEKSSVDYNKTGISLSAIYNFSENNLVTISLADSYRLPSHMENYGYLLYNVLDGFFYSGNPDLRAEHSRQIEIKSELNFSNLYLNSAFYYTDIRDYIGGKLIEDEFKIYSNFDQAEIKGFEASLVYLSKNGLNLKTSFNYSLGYIYDLKESMPYIPPFQGSISADYTFNKIWLELRSRFAADQKRIASENTLEDKTSGHIIWDIRSRIKLNDNWEIKTGIENIFDKFYHDHLSISNLPSKGRNIYIGINFSYQ